MSISSSHRKLYHPLLNAGFNFQCNFIAELLHDGSINHLCKKKKQQNKITKKPPPKQAAAFRKPYLVHDSRLFLTAVVTTVDFCWEHKTKTCHFCSYEQSTNCSIVKISQLVKLPFSHMDLAEIKHFNLWPKLQGGDYVCVLHWQYGFCSKCINYYSLISLANHFSFYPARKLTHLSVQSYQAKLLIQIV